MRTALLVSCDHPDDVAPALAADADALVFDLDGASATRPARRAATLAALLRSAVSARPPRRLVRLGALDGGLVDGDLEAVMAGAPDAVVLPRAVGRAAVERLGAKLAVHEALCGLAAGRTRIVAAPADTGAGLLALGTLSAARGRLAALLWTPDTLAADLGAADPEAEPCRLARTLVLAAAAACRVPAMEAVGDAEADALARRRDAAGRDGFAALLLRRPGQLSIAREGEGAGRCAAPRVD